MKKVRRISKKYRLRQFVAYFMAFCMFCHPAVLAEVVHTSTQAGTINVGPVVVDPLGPDTQAMSATDGSIGTFSNFDIANGLIVNCTQGDPSYNALFKVNSVNGTQIYGIFNSDGNIYLQDLRSILIGPTGEINTNQFVATAVNIKNSDWQDFINGVTNQLRFEKLIEDPTGVIENQGTINASSVYLVGSQVLNNGTITAPDLLVMAAGDKVFLTHEDSKVLIKVPTDLMTPDPAINKVDIDAASTITAGQVVLAAGDVFTAALDVGSLAATANRNITLEDAVTTTGDITLDAEEDVYAHGLATTGGGNINIHSSDSTTHLYGDVTTDVVDGGSIYLHNRSEVDDDVTIQAGDDVFILALLTALGDITIEATGGGIDATDIFMSVDDSLLSLTQESSLHMEDALQHVGNSEDTDLYAKSTAGAVTSSKADTWQSIEAEAATFINLNDSDTGGDITTKALTTDTGDILITSDFGKVYVEGPIDAGRDVIITAKDEGSDGTEDAILLYGAEEGGKSIDAGRDIWLNNNTWAAAGYYLDALQDVRVGWDEDHLEYDPKTLTGAGALTVEAARHITLGGDVTANGDLKLLADYDEDSAVEEFHDGVGNMTALGSLETTNSDLGVVGKNIQIDGTVDIAGEIWMYAADDITLGDSVIADDDIILYADWDPGVAWDYDDGVGTMWAKSTIDSTWGKIDLRASDDTIKLDDNVTAYDDILLRNNTVVAAGKKLESTGDDVVLAEGKSITGLGSLDIVADEDIILGVTDVDQHWDAPEVGSGGNVSADGDLTLTAVDDIYAHGTLSTTSGGDIELTSADDTTYLWDNVTAAGDIILNNNTEVKAAGKTLDAGDDMVLAADKTLDSDFDLTIEADDDIILGVTNAASHWVAPEVGSGGNVSADGDLTLTAVDDIYAHGTLSTTSGGDIEGWGQNITVDGAIDSAGSLTLTAYENITLNSSADSAEVMWLKADFDGDHIGDLWAKSYLDTASQGLGATGENITVDGTSDSGAWINMTAGDNITLGDDATASGSIVLTGDSDTDTVGNVWAKGKLTSTGGNIDIYSSDNTTILSGDWVEAFLDVTLHNNTELDGGALQEIKALTGKLTAEGYVRKTTAGNLNMFGGYDQAITGPDYDQFSVSTKEVKVDDGATDGELTITGNAYVKLDGNIYSRGNMTLTSNDNGGAPFGDLRHTQGTIQSLNGDVDLTAKNHAIYLHGGVEYDPGNPATTTYVKAGEDIILHNDTYINGSRNLVAGDDVEAFGTVTGEGDLTINAGTIEPGSASNYANIRLNQTVTVGGSLVMTAGDDIEAAGTLTANGTWLDTAGNIILNAGDNIDLDGTTVSAQSAGLMELIADLDPSNGTGNVDVDGSLEGNMKLSGSSLEGNMKLSGTNVYVDGTVTSHGTLDVDADEDIELRANVSSVGEMTMDAGSDIELNRSSGNTTSSESTITLNAGDDITIGEPGEEGNVTADGHMGISAGDDWNDDVKVYGKLTTTGGGNINVQAGDDITIWGTHDGPVYESVEADGVLTMSSNTSGVGFFGGDLYIAGDTIAESMQLEAGAGGPPDYSPSHVRVDGLLQTTGGDMVVMAHHDVLLGGNVDSAGNLVLNADRHGEYGYPDPHVYGGDVEVEGTIVADGTIDMYGNNITLWDSVTSTDDMTITADTSPDYDYQSGDPVGDVFAHGMLTSTDGSIEISASDDTIYLSDDVTAAVDVTLNNNTVFDGDDDQEVDAQTGMITAGGWLWKNSDEGSLYLEAAGDISLADHVEVDWGGVSIISENGKIFTEADSPDPEAGDYMLNIGVYGWSDDYDGDGVDLPYPEGDPVGKAAIVIMSAEDLKLGPDAELIAEGAYDDTGAVDDRQGVRFLDTPDTIIGSVLRDEGDPFDVAVYLASTEGDVDVSSPVMIGSFELDQFEREVFIPEGAMVIDAFDTVTFDGQIDGQFEASLAAGEVGDRLEVVSRITEWLFQAIGLLPYAEGGGPFPDDYVYVLRGAGLGNPTITDGRAWVLENPLPPANIDTLLITSADRQTLGLDGCPVLLAAAASELGVAEETIEVALENALALSMDIQPCDSCARLVDAAAILRDDDGSRMAAMNQAFNELAPAGAPFTPAMATSIVTTFADHVGDGTYYASAIEYIDAFVQYVAVLDAEMGSLVGDDSIAFVMSKYGTAMTESENSNMAAFVAARLAGLETF
ncbi:MAG: hypothetical protein ACYS1A_11375 [Planctomycetota bacterium]